MNGNETTNMPSRNTIRWRVLPALAFLLLLAPGATPATAFEGFKHPKASQLQCRTACHQPENLQQARQDKFAKPECRQCHTGESPAQAGGLFRTPGAVIQFEDTVPNRRQLSARPPVRAALAEVLSRVAARQRGRIIHEVRFLAPEGGAAALEKILGEFSAEAPFGIRPGAVASIHCPSASLYDLIAALKGAGAGTISVAGLEMVFEADNALYGKLVSRFGWR